MRFVDRPETTVKPYQTDFSFPNGNADQYFDVQSEFAVSQEDADRLLPLFGMSQEGSGNRATLDQNGTANMFLSRQQGNGNVLYATQDGTANVGAVSQAGNSNLAVMNQRGGGLYDQNQALIGQIGDSNTAFVTQSVHSQTTRLIVWIRWKVLRVRTMMEP